MQKASARLADGRELIYFGPSANAAARYQDQREPGRPGASSVLRHDPLLGEWVISASHRQDRTHQPSAADCPLCPSAPGRLTEIPAPGYDVAVFENRFAALAGTPADGPPDGGGLLASRPGYGRCEVVCFSQDHEASLATLPPAQLAMVLAAWTDRSTVLAELPGVQQVYCFENRGAEIGATLSHPHGQIYAYPFVTPRTARMLQMCERYRCDAGRNLFDDVLAAERSAGSRLVLDGEHWTAHVPHAARWPYEVHLYPRRRVPGLAALTGAEAAEFCELYPDLLRRLDALFGSPAPYIAAWHQAPASAAGEFALHLELFTVRRAAGKLKYLAGTESGMGSFSNDIAPEQAAALLRRAG